ncbi:MAG: alkaline phosphatase D family protein [Bacteroidota bacterium]
MNFNKILFWIIVILSSLLFSCQKEVSPPVSYFRSAWSSEKEIVRPWAGGEYWLNPLQAWEQKNGRLNVVASGGDRNCVLLTHELNGNGDYFAMEVSVENLVQNDTSGWAGFQIGLKGQFDDYRDDAVHGRGFCVGVANDGHLFIGNIKEKIKTEINSKKYHLEIKAKPKSKTEYFFALSYFHQNGEHTLETIAHKSWLKGLVALCSSEQMPDSVDLKNKKPWFHKVPELQKKAGGNTFHAFSNWMVTGDFFSTHEDRKFGPILWSQYTLSNNVLKLSVQFAPIGNDNKTVRLYMNGMQVQEAEINPLANNVVFKISDWDSKRNHDYQIAYYSKKRHREIYKGVINKEPIKEKIKVASLSCVDDRGFPHQDLVKNVKDHEADLFVFHGDQIYERVGGYGVERSSNLDYLRKWYIWGWSFRDLFLDKPVIIIPDDHDVFHGNLWGEAGKRANTALGWGYDSQDDGGYKEPPEFVNMVHRTQTGHLPDAFDPTPVSNNISVYYTNMNYGGISFAILGDRQWKSAPKNLLPDAQIENGWPQNKKWNAKTDAFHPDAELLGARQELFLENWAADWNNDIYFKAVISQSPFCNVATLPKDIYHDKYVPGLPRYKKGGYPPDDRPVADFDSNSWPQNKRNHAVKIIRKGFAVHLTGDQHLGSTGQYGVDEFGEGSFWVSTPAVSNLWPRRWFPAEMAKTGRAENDPRYVGDYEDGFGNKITVKAIANPYDIEREPDIVFDKAPGYSVIVFDKKNRNIEAAVWPRWSSPKNEKQDNQPFDGWPINIAQEHNYGKKVAGHLPELMVAADEYVQLYAQGSNELIYAIRPPAGNYRAKVFDENLSYKILKIKDGVVVEELNDLKIK